MLVGGRVVAIGGLQHSLVSFCCTLGDQTVTTGAVCLPPAFFFCFLGRLLRLGAFLLLLLLFFVACWGSARGRGLTAIVEVAGGAAPRAGNVSGRGC